MRELLYILTFTIIPFLGNAQDTTDVYVINKTNRLVQIDNSYSYFYRDLKYIKEIRELKFDSIEDINAFFEKAYRVLDKDITLVSKGYNLMRNKLSKNVLKMRNKDDGYMLLKRGTIDNMKQAVNNSH